MDEIKEFLERIKKTKSINTYLAYQKSLFLFREFLESKGYDLRKITNKEAFEFYNYLNERYLSKRSINQRLSAIKSFYNYLFSTGRVSMNPFLLVQVKVEKLLPKPLSLSQLNIILKEASLLKKDIYLAIFGLVSLGLRISELLNLRKEDFYFNEVLKVRVLGKGKKERFTISIFEKFNDEIKLFLATKKDDEKVFNFTGRLLRYYCEHLSKKTGIKFSPHSLRHTYATLLVKKKIPLEKVSLLLGHSNIETTRIYTKIEMADIEDEMRKVIRSLNFVSHLKHYLKS